MFSPFRFFALTLLVATLFACGNAYSKIPLESRPGVERIIGGTTAQIVDFPYQVALFMKQDSTTYYICGGSIIDADWVLTAAHCLYDEQGHPRTGVSYSVGAGSNRWRDVPVVIQAAQHIVHPAYDPVAIDNDLALIQLKHSFQFSTTISPLPLATSLPSLGSPVTLSGWGLTQDDGDVVDVLQTVIVPIRDPSDCQLTIAELPDKFCAGQANPTEDTCQGDSGGPAVNSAGQQIGIVSYGIADTCDGRGIYTRVDHYDAWISATMAANPVPPTTSAAFALYAPSLALLVFIVLSSFLVIY